MLTLIERPLYSPVMWQVHPLPMGIVKTGLYKGKIVTRIAVRAHMPVGRVSNKRIGGRKDPVFQRMGGRGRRTCLRCPGIRYLIVVMIRDHGTGVVDQGIRL